MANNCQMLKQIGDISGNEAREALDEIVKILWPPDAPDQEWSGDTLEALSNLLDDLGLIPDYL